MGGSFVNNMIEYTKKPQTYCTCKKICQYRISFCAMTMKILHILEKKEKCGKMEKPESVPLFHTHNCCPW